MKPITGQSLIFILTLSLLNPNSAASETGEDKGGHGNQAAVTYEVGKPVLAAILTSFNLPFRGILCLSDMGLAFITMGTSAGRRYAQGADFIEQGCAGPWFLTPWRITKEQQKVEKLKGAAFTPYDQW